MIKMVFNPANRDLLELVTYNKYSLNRFDNIKFSKVELGSKFYFDNEEYDMKLYMKISDQNGKLFAACLEDGTYKDVDLNQMVWIDKKYTTTMKYSNVGIK